MLEKIELGSKEYLRKLSELNDHDKKIEKLNKNTVRPARVRDESEISFFSNLNAIDDELDAMPSFKESFNNKSGKNLLIL